MMDYRTYREQRLGGFDPINDPVDWLFDRLPELNGGTVINLLLCLLELLS